MALIVADIKQYGSLGMPANDVDASGGAIDTSNEISDATIGGIFPTLSIDDEDTKTWYYKIFIKNTNVTYDWYNVYFWIENLLIPIVASGTVALVSSSTSDTNKLCRVIMENAAGTETYENVVLNGTTTVYSSGSATKVKRIEIRNSTSPYALNTAIGEITITRGIELGKIPVGCNGAIGEIRVGLDLDIDDDLDSADRLTAPDGVSFSRPNSSYTALASTGSGQDIPAESAQGIWIEWSVEAGSISSTDIPLWFSFYGSNSD